MFKNIRQVGRGLVSMGADVVAKATTVVVIDPIKCLRKEGEAAQSSDRRLKLRNPFVVINVKDDSVIIEGEATKVE